MPRIPSDFIDNLLERTDIVSLIDARVPLKKAGHEYQARCPFHDEKTPSFTVSPGKQFYHCFGCGAHGSAISFLMEHDRLEFLDAVELLAHQAGMQLPETAGQGSESNERLTPLYDALACADKYYQKALRQAPDAIAYLKNRGISGATAKQFGLGYAPENWRNLEAQLPEARSAIACGLVIEQDNGNQYDRFRNRLMFPIRDTRGRTIAFGGRTLGDDKAKYLNSPETPLFHKSRRMYGLFEARQAMRHLPRLLVVEGYMDVIALAQNGFANTVATLGTATTPEHLTLLFRHTEEVVFCFDGDTAGQRAAQKAMQQSLPAMRGARSVRFLFLPEDEDPDSLIRADNGPARLQSAIDEARPLSAMLLDAVLDGHDTPQTPEQRARVKERARPLLAAMPPDTFREEMAKEFAQLTHDEPDHLLAELTQHNKPAAPPPPTPANRNASQARAVRVTAVSRALELLLHNTALATNVEDTATLRESTVRGAEIVADAVETFKKNPNLPLASWLERYRDNAVFNRLQAIAASIPPGEDSTQHRLAFLDSVQQLQYTNRRDHLRERYNTLLECQASRTLDDSEAEELKRILAELKPN